MAPLSSTVVCENSSDEKSSSLGPLPLDRIPIGLNIVKIARSGTTPSRGYKFPGQSTKPNENINILGVLVEHFQASFL